MFMEADTRATAYASQVEGELYKRLDYLDKTASTWFDDKSSTVESRRDEINRTFALCRRVASLPTTQEDDAETLQVIAENLKREAQLLEPVITQLKTSEYRTQVGDAPIFSSQGLTDESRTGSRMETDWDLFMAIEPKNFVTANRDCSEQETRTRAFNYIADATVGHGLSRKAKIEIAETFLTEVEGFRDQALSQKTAKKVVVDRVFADSDIFI